LFLTYADTASASIHHAVLHVIIFGTGTSDKPATGYDKRNMAKDIKELIELLGYKKVVMIGHDRGARVTTRFAKDHPHMIDRICTMDNIPTRIVFESMNGRGGDFGLKVSPGALAKGYWFFLFNQVMDLPEALITGREEIWLRHWHVILTHAPLRTVYLLFK
jgi:haloacetate dehalogenase